MIQLIQFPWSPFCLVQRRILECSGARFKIINLPAADRSLVWKLTKERYYQVPIIEDDGHVVFEMDDQSQVIAKYIDAKLQLGLFALEWEGVQKVLWQHIENEVEGLTFKLNDAHYREFVPKAQHLGYVRHKERKFGRGCLDRWFEERSRLQAQLERQLAPFEQMLRHKEYLLENRPLFADFDLWGMLANYMFTGHYRLSASLPELKKWYGRMGRVKLGAREKLHS